MIINQIRIVFELIKNEILILIFILKTTKGENFESD